MDIAQLQASIAELSAPRRATTTNWSGRDLTANGQVIVKVRQRTRAEE
jgi:hypothetical protein